MPARILIVEDEPDLAELIALYCHSAQWQTLICASAEEALGALRAAHFDLITLDLNLPGMDGFDFLKQVRAQFMLPVIIVSAREADEEIVNGLNLGADEYVTKPFAPKVLVARISALLRRSQQQANTSPNLLYFSDYVLDPEAYSLKQGDERIALSTREFDILLLLAKNLGKPISAYEILDQVWGGQHTETSAVGVYVQRLRKKIDTDPNKPSLIETVHGRGYCLNQKLG